MRKNAISIELRDKAKEIYKGLPNGVKKGEWVSDAIEDKAAKEQSQHPFTEEQIKELMQMEDRILQKVLKELEKK